MLTSVHHLSFPLFLLLLGLVVIVPYLIGGLFLFLKPVLQPFIKKTNELINLTFLTHIVIFGVTVVGGLIGVGHLAPGDLGLRWSDLPEALLVTAGLWGVAQLVEVCIGWLSTKTIERHTSWKEKGWTTQLGSLLGQLFGSALNEEIFYRGFLLIQCYLLLSDLGYWPSWLALLIALLSTQLLFALFHIPILLLQHTPTKRLTGDLLAIFIAGLLFSLLYLRTTNLLLVVGIHSIFNFPLPVIKGAKDSQIVIFICALLLLLGWQLFTSIR